MSPHLIPSLLIWYRHLVVVNKRPENINKWEVSLVPD